MIHFDIPCPSNNTLRGHAMDCNEPIPSRDLDPITNLIVDSCLQIRNQPCTRFGDNISVCKSSNMAFHESKDNTFFPQILEIPPFSIIAASLTTHITCLQIRKNIHRRFQDKIPALSTGDSPRNSHQAQLQYACSWAMRGSNPHRPHIQPICPVRRISRTDSPT